MLTKRNARRPWLRATWAPGLQRQDIAGLVVPVFGRKRVLREQRFLEIFALDELNGRCTLGLHIQLEDADELLAEIEHETGRLGCRE